MTEHPASSSGGTWAAFVVGALAGAGIALLYAPRTGKETRELLADRLRQLKRKAREGIEEAGVVIENKQEDLRTAFEDTRDGSHSETIKPRI